VEEEAICPHKWVLEGKPHTTPMEWLFVSRVTICTKPGDEDLAVSIREELHALVLVVSKDKTW
jgi:hypothetical protein